MGAHYSNNSTRVTGLRYNFGKFSRALQVFRAKSMYSFALKLVAVGIFLGATCAGVDANAALLQNGVPATGLAGATATELSYTFQVPAGATSLTFQMSGGSGDADLYVRFGAAPTTSNYDCRPYLGGNDESCVTPTTAGTWYIMVRGYAAFANVSLVATYATGGGGLPQLQNGVPAIGLSGATGATLQYTFQVPAGVTGLTFQMSGGSGDADLYVRFGAAPTVSTYDCRPYVGGNNETCAMPSATAGTWYVMVRGYTTFSNVSLLATYTTGGANTPPTANAGPDQTATAGMTVTLPGSGVDAEGPISAYAWTQTTPVSPSVGITNGNTATASFIAPTVTVASVFTFKLTVTDNQGASGSDSVNVTIQPAGGGGGNQLQNGVPATGLSGATGATLQYTFQVPAGVTGLTFQISGGSGDADLYVRFGAAPTVSTYDCRPYVGGNNETCAMPSATAGTWYVMVRGYTTFSNVSLLATYTVGGGGGGATQLQPAVPTTGQAGSAGQNLLYTLDVPAGATNLIFQMTGTSGDADLYVRYGSAPTTNTYDCRPYLAGNNENCVMPSATAGTWYVMVQGFAAFTGVRLGASYAIPGGNLVIPPPVAGAAVCVTTARENPVVGVLPCPSGGSGQCGNFSIPANQNGSKGTAALTNPATGQYTYTPQGTSWGVDSFGYVANDAVTGIQYAATAVVIISPRIIPVGDSITSGVNNGNAPAVATRVGFRKPLYDALLGAGYTVDFVGTRNDGYSVFNFDPDNEGHPGWTAFELGFGTSYVPIQDPTCPTCNLIDWLNAKKPDIILLHIGTNGFTTDTTDVAAMLNFINLWSTGPNGNPVAVFLAQIINRNPYQSVNVLLYNQNLSILSQNRQSVGVGPLTYLVNQETALTYPADLLGDPSGLHPDANGYAKMANRWFTGLVSSGLLPKCP